MARVGALLLVAVVSLATAAPLTAEPEVALYPMVFPVVGSVNYTDTWQAPRSGGRVHLGTDIMAAKMTPVVAVAAGTIRWMRNTIGVDCCYMALSHDDGWESWYIHLNNDTPGTDDGLGYGFTEGIVPGVHVEAGQLIGYVGDSGNAEAGSPHLHFELHQPEVGPVNPYPHLVAARSLPQPFEGPDRRPCPDGATCDSVALVSPEARFHVHQRIERLPSVDVYLYGNPGDVPLMGDWDCDGTTTPAMYRPTNGFMYLRNSNTQGIAELEYFYGDPADIPLAGDFDGDGCDTLAIYRSDEGKVYVKNTLGSGVADYSFFFGNPGDKPFVGDFDGDGIDTIGLHRASTGFVYFRDQNEAGPADFEFFYGDPGDKIVAGDWDGDGDDTVAVYRPSSTMLYVKLTNTDGVADYSVPVGDFATMLVASGLTKTPATP